MNGLKNKSLNNKKIKLYQLPLIDRIMYLLSAVGLTTLPIALFFMEFPYFIINIALLLLMIIYSIVIYFWVFKRYICLDFEKQEFIIREYSGIKKEIIKLYYIEKIVFKDSEKYKRSFTIQIRFKNSSLFREISSWSGYPSGELMINSYNRQKRRLLKFIQKCNVLLNQMNEVE